MQRTHIFMFLLLLGNSGGVQSKTLMTVFIHGTVQTGISLLCGGERTWKDQFDGSSWCEDILRVSRNTPEACRNDLMLHNGLVPITSEQLAARDQEPYKYYAAYHTVHAFDCAAQQVRPARRLYYAFGWSGLLSESTRKAAARELYDALYAEYEYQKQSDADIEIELYSHSHGGQLVLYLPQVRAEKNNKTFCIDRVYLSATPLYYESARNVLHGMLRTVINLYSYGDPVQVMDFVSIPGRVCKRRFADLALPLPPAHTSSCTIIDCCILGAGNKKFFGHGPFFILQRYRAPRGNRAQRKLYRELIDQLAPLPLVTLYPLLTAQLPEQPGYYQHDVVMQCNEETGALCVALAGTAFQPIVAPTAWHESRQATAALYSKTGYLSEVGKALHSIKYAIKRAMHLAYETFAGTP